MLKITLLKNQSVKLFYNLIGWKTNRKIVVIESDDWGSIRTSSTDAQKILRKNNIDIDKCHYMLYDSLESEEDLSFLFELLREFKDSAGNHPVITANVLVANPDFDRIKKDNFCKYYWEPVTESFKKYPKHSKSFGLWLNGLREGVFYPQSHGREHLNIQRWMNDLKKKRKDTMIAFDLGIFGLSQHIVNEKRDSYLATFDGKDDMSNNYKKEAISEGLNLFEKFFGFNSFSFIAPNYTWDEIVEEALNKNGVKYLQGTRAQLISKNGNEKRKIKRHYLGQKNNLQQIYLVRNVNFEPSENLDKDWIDLSMKEISNAFFWKKPAIISMHRVNFMGFLNKKNRDRNLRLLKSLLQNIIKRWPDVLFYTSPQLGKLIELNSK